MPVEGRTHQPVVEHEKCLVTCKFCRLLCPDLAITRNGDKGKIEIDYDYCKGCGICAAICPQGAIKMVVDKP
ncbi:4Fe-4S binding protein [Chloroflexota bacterium]